MVGPPVVNCLTDDLPLKLYSLTCRHRKLKCDEVKPTCGQCRKSDRECVFSQDTRFRHFDVQGLLRQGQEKTAAGHTASDGLFGKDQIWIDIPGDRLFSLCLKCTLDGPVANCPLVTFVNISNPFEEETTASEDELLLQHVAHGRDCSEDIPRGGQANALITPPSQDAGNEVDNSAVLQPDCVPEPPQYLGSTLGDLLTDSHVSTLRSASSAAEERRNSGACTPPTLEPEDDVPFEEDSNDPERSILGLKLLRHFREGPGQW